MRGAEMKKTPALAAFFAASIILGFAANASADPAPQIDVRLQDSAGRFAPDRFRLHPLKGEPLPGLQMSLGELGLRRDALGGTLSRSLGIGSFQLKPAIAIAPGLELRMSARGTFSIVQGTALESGRSDPMRPCASQSELDEAIDLEVAKIVAVGVFAEQQGDPVHFGDGDDCAGDGTLWTSSSKIGGDLLVHLPRRLELRGHVERATHQLHTEEAVHARGAANDVGVNERRAVTAGLTLSVATM